MVVPCPTTGLRTAETGSLVVNSSFSTGLADLAGVRWAMADWWRGPGREGFLKKAGRAVDLFHAARREYEFSSPP